MSKPLSSATGGMRFGISPNTYSASPLGRAIQHHSKLGLIHLYGL
jgi:hypothetical protein